MRLQEIILRDTRANQPAAGDVPIGTLYFVTDEFVTERSDGTTWESFADSGGGDVQGPVASTDDNIATFDGATGKLIQDGGKTIAESEADAAAVAVTVMAAPTYLTETDETALLPNSRQVLAGTNITFDDTTPGQRTINASGGGGGSSDWTTTITKSIDEDDTTQVLQNDDELLIAMLTGEVWWFQLLLLYSGSAAAVDFKMNFAFPASSGFYRYAGGNSNTDAFLGHLGIRLGSAVNLAAGNLVWGTTATGLSDIRFALVEVFIRAEGNGDFQLQWSNNGVGTARCCQGSVLRGKKLI